MRPSFYARFVGSLIALLLVTGCSVFTDTDIGDAPSPPENCIEGARRCSVDGRRIELCGCRDDVEDAKICRFQAETSCESAQQCADGISSTACGARCGDSGFEQYWALDADGDNHAAPETERLSCDSPGEGYRLSSTLQATFDCNDDDAGISPSRTEKPGNLIDEDCNGKIACYVDRDQDGYVPTSPAGAIFEEVADTQCRTSDGYRLEASEEPDCDDTRGTVYPGAPELCNGIDDNCNGLPDVGLSQDPELAGICFDVGEIGCADADQCVTDTCLTRSVFPFDDSRSVCVSAKPTCEEYCTLYERVKDSCDFYLPPNFEQCSGPACDEPPARQACIAACQSIVGKETGYETFQAGTYNDDDSHHTLGCRGSHFIDAILAPAGSSARADDCARGTLSTGGYCQTRENYARCEPVADGGDTFDSYEPPACALGSLCTFSGNRPYKICSPMCKVTIRYNTESPDGEAGTTSESFEVQCPKSRNISPDIDGDCVLIGSFDDSGLDDPGKGTVSKRESLRCLAACPGPYMNCDGPLSNDDPSLDTEFECQSWPTRNGAPQCFPYEEVLPKLLCTRDIKPGYSEVERDSEIFEDLGPAGFLTALESIVSPQDAVDDLGVTDCFADDPPGCAPEDCKCDGPKAGCDDCVAGLAECLRANCSTECAGVPSGKNYASSSCACCMTEKLFGSDRTCFLNFRVCSGIRDDFFVPLLPPACPPL